MTDDNAASRAGPSGRITWWFNLGLLVFLLCLLGVEIMLEPHETERVPMDDLFDAAPALAVVGGLLFVAAALVVGVLITLAFWNRYMTDVFNVRRINVAEAVAINLVIAIFFAPS